MCLRGLGPALAAALCLAGAAAAQEDPSKWLPPGSTVAATLAEYPARWIRSEMAGGEMGYQARLGELVFRSPLTLGRDAARRGLSCEACHPNGAANSRFFVPGPSDRPGNVDVSHRTFHFREDDGVDNPLNIPSLRGVRWTAPYGHDGRFASLARFSRNVIMREFGGPEPEPWMLDALVAYQLELAFAPGADAAAAEAYRRHCAGCHGGPDVLPDGRRHDIGTGGWFEAPPLLGLAETAPYLHDGSAATPEAAIASHRGLALDGTATADVVAFLEGFGAVERRFDPETLDGDLDRLQRFLDLVNQPLLDEDGVRADRVGDMVLMEIGRIHRRFGDGADEAQAWLEGWARSLDEVLDQGLAEAYPAARASLKALKATIETDRLRLAAATAGTLYAETAGQ